jgi:hypothetical protein
MTTEETTAQEMSVSDLAVARMDVSACWSVEERAWKQELPELPDEVSALLAPPVVVSASAFQRPAGHHVPRHAARVA